MGPCGPFGPTTCINIDREHLSGFCSCCHNLIFITATVLGDVSGCTSFYTAKIRGEHSNFVGGRHQAKKT